MCIQNAKKFNVCNENFLPYRQADMADCFLLNLRQQLALYHEDIAHALLNICLSSSSSYSSSSGTSVGTSAAAGSSNGIGNSSATSFSDELEAEV